MIRFTKAKAAPKKPKSPKNAVLDKLKAYLAAAEPEAAAILTSNLDGLQNAVTYRELREAYLSGGLTQDQFEKWEMVYTKLVASALAPKWEAAARAGALEVKGQFPFLCEPSISAGLEFIRRHGAELVTNSAQEQINALNAIIAHVSGYEMVTPDEAARIMRSCVGLTKPQAIANAKYRESVKQAFLKANPRMRQNTAEKRASEAAARYAARQHRYRAQNIARTELAFAYNAGAYGATKDAQARGYIGDCVKVWLTAYDERVCPVCSAMDGEKRNMDEAFSNGKLLPPAHPSCRCAVAFEEIPGTGVNLMPTAGGADRENDLTGTDSGSTMRISGARIIDPYSPQAEAHADRYYGLVRSMTTDVARIAQNTGYSVEEIQHIKDYLFMDTHDLGEAGIRRFYSDFAISQSWQRLIAGTPETHDLTLLRHELMERQLILEGMSQDDAHLITSGKYNYTKEVREFYGSLNKHSDRR